jgi:hypothetical protein
VNIFIQCILQEGRSEKSRSKRSVQNFDTIHVDVIIVDPTWTYLVSHVISSCGMVAMVVNQAKIGLYHDQHLINAFLPIDIRVFGCLHQQMDNFFHQCANMAWSAKDISGLLLVVLWAFYRQKVLAILQRMQATFILKHNVVVGELGSFRFTILSCFPSIFL